MVRAIGAVLLTLAAVILPAVPASASPGDLDPGFGRGGLVKVDDGPIRDLAISDGRVVVLLDGPFQVVQLLRDGSLDQAVAGNGLSGRAYWPSCSAGELAAAGDGGLYIVGTCGAGDASDFAVLKLDRDGEPDPGFGADGRLQIPLPGRQLGRMLALSADGPLLVGGPSSAPGSGSFDRIDLVRITPQGELDPSFGSAGVASVGAYLGAGDLAVDPMGRALVGGALGAEAFVARLTAEGSPDPSFGDGGRWVSPDVSEASKVALAARPGGGVAVAMSHNIGTFDFEQLHFVYQLGPGGTPDQAFGDAGTVAPIPLDYLSDDLLLGPGGSLSLAGTIGREPYRSAGPSYPGVLRIESSGELEARFGGGGRAAYRAFGIGASQADQTQRRLLLGGGSKILRVQLTRAPHNLDADHLVDRDDRCPEAYSKRRRGCPRVGRRLDMSGSPRGFGGELRAPNEYCVFGRGYQGYPVNVFKVVAGRRDKRIATTKTRAFNYDGTWDVSSAAKPGRYYAQSPRRTFSYAGRCTGVRSQTVRVR